MTDAAFQGTFSDFRLVKSRGVAQFTIETPLEQADAALAMLGGVPKPGVELWVAIARLVAKPAPDKPPRQRLTSERAAMLCNDGVFARWLTDEEYPPVEYVTNALRARLGIQSRRELDTDPEARARFEALEAEYLQSTGRMAHER
jgi:hypothetical protein